MGERERGRDEHKRGKEREMERQGGRKGGQRKRLEGRRGQEKERERKILGGGVAMKNISKIAQRSH